ncbi:cytochrome c1, heme protein, mitochondrial [Augochlora pura]
MKRIVQLAGLAAAGCGTVLYLLNDSVKASVAAIELPNYPWKFQRTFQSFDHATLRRGWQIYRTVCYTCHSLRYMKFMDLTNQTHTEEEVKEIAAEFEVQDGPDDEGNYYMRPAKFSDAIPKPFPNEQAARVANFGSYPPDLTYIVYSRHNGFNFLFSYLTGFRDPPAGVKLNDGQHFNPYFSGCVTGMAPILYDGMMEFEDGTPATESQMAKDLVEFLSWTAAPEHDTRQLMLLKGLAIFTLLSALSYDIYRRNISHLKSRRMAYVPK